jgi:hypothetical protein
MKNKSIADVFYNVFSRVYTSDSYNPFTDKFNERDECDDGYQHLRNRDQNGYLDNELTAKRNQIIKDYSRSYITMLASFFGLPNECSFGQEQSWYNVFVINFLGWKEFQIKDRKKSAIAWDAIKNIISMIFFYVPKNTLVALIQIPRNLLKLATEFLPLFAADLAKFAMVSLKESVTGIEPVSGSRFVLSFMASVGLLIFVTVPALVLHFVGRAITSPIKGVLYAHDGIPMPSSWLPKFMLRAFLGWASFMMTVTAYAFLFPLIAIAGPALFGINLAAQITAVPSLSTLGVAFLGFLNYALAAMHMVTPAMTMFAGIGALATMAFNVVGIGYSILSGQRLARKHREDDTATDVLEKERLQRPLDGKRDTLLDEHKASSSHEINKSLGRELSLSGEEKSRKATVSSSSEKKSEEAKALSSSEERKSKEATASSSREETKSKEAKASSSREETKSKEEKASGSREETKSEEAKASSSREEVKSKEEKASGSREEAEVEAKLSNSLGDFFATFENKQPVNDAEVKLDAGNRASLSG